MFLLSIPRIFGGNNYRALAKAVMALGFDIRVTFHKTEEAALSSLILTPEEKHTYLGLSAVKEFLGRAHFLLRTESWKKGCCHQQ